LVLYGAHLESYSIVQGTIFSLSSWICLQEVLAGCQGSCLQVLFGVEMVLFCQLLTAQQVSSSRVLVLYAAWWGRKPYG